MLRWKRPVPVKRGVVFAVVAGEVRALAQRSADAARQIKALIETSVAKVEQGTQLVNDAGATMTDIVAQAQRVAGLIAEISRRSRPSRHKVLPRWGALWRTWTATQQNAAMVEQSAAAAQALRHQAAQLGAAVRVFRLTGVDSAYESRHLPAHRLQGTAPALAPATLRNAAAARITKLQTAQT